MVAKKNVGKLSSVACCTGGHHNLTKIKPEAVPFREFMAPVKAPNDSFQPPVIY